MNLSIIRFCEDIVAFDGVRPRRRELGDDLGRMDALAHGEPSCQLTACGRPGLSRLGVGYDGDLTLSEIRRGLPSSIGVDRDICRCRGRI